MDKRTFLKRSLLGGTALAIAGKNIISAGGLVDIGNETTESTSADVFVQPPLGYAYNALEPYIDAMTMEIHYSKHHAGYTKNLNAALAEQKVSGKTIEQILSEISTFPAAIRNNAGGFYNHNLFWNIMTPGGNKNPQGKLAESLNKNFGSFENFKSEFSKKAMSVFGSGWTWLVASAGNLKIIGSPNQDNPLMDISQDKGTPLVMLDVWEHAYYLKYQNRRKEYVDNFWNVINWDKAAEAFSRAS